MANNIFAPHQTATCRLRLATTYGSVALWNRRSLTGRARPAPAWPETTLYYGLNTAYSLSQVLFALMGLLAIRNGVEAIGRWPGLTLAFGAVGAWLAICFLFLEYSQPRITVGLFAALLLGVAFSG